MPYEELSVTGWASSGTAPRFRLELALAASLLLTLGGCTAPQGRSLGASIGGSLLALAVGGFWLFAHVDLRKAEGHYRRREDRATGDWLRYCRRRNAVIFLVILVALACGSH